MVAKTNGPVHCSRVLSFLCTLVDTKHLILHPVEQYHVALRGLRANALRWPPISVENTWRHTQIEIEASMSYLLLLLL
jgi:hypothetical protein